MKLSFLTSCMDRCHNLKKTYLHNINNSLPIDGVDVEFVLLNYNSSDDLDVWVHSELVDLPVEFKYVKTNTPKYFHMSKTKNVLGKSATGDILCWLDADNMTQPKFVEYVVDVFGGNTNSVLQVLWKPETSGMCGRVVCSKSDFLKVGGYNEGFSGWGDEELIGCVSHEIPERYLGKLENTEHERMDNYKPGSIVRMSPQHRMGHMQYTSNYMNFQKSCEAIQHGEHIANQGNSWGKL